MQNTEEKINWGIYDSMTANLDYNIKKRAALFLLTSFLISRRCDVQTLSRSYIKLKLKLCYTPK